MTALLLIIDPAVVGVALILWTWAGLSAGSLWATRTPEHLRRRANRLLVLIGLGGLTVLARIVATLVLAGDGWWFVQDKVLLGLPVLALPAIAVLAVSVPRLVGVGRSARALAGIGVVAPSVRQQAAHPLLVWPIQLAAFGAAAAEVAFFVVSYPVTAGSAFAVLVGVGVAGVVCWHRLVRRHARLGAEVVVASPAARLLRGAGMLTGLVAVAVAVPLAALAVAAPAAPEHADAHHGQLDLGGGPPEATSRETPVTDLRGRPSGEPVRQFTLTARHARITTATGEAVDALTYDGTLPGPELRVSEGDFVEVRLRNADIAEGVTIHWHGYDVPNGEDGVPGVTQEAVGIGQEFVYRFRADQVGSFWYHSHQSSYRQVTRGLYGVLVVTPKASAPDQADIAAAYHRLDDGPVMVAGATADVRREIEPGTTVRLRVLNCANSGNRFALLGVSATMAALDGTDLNAPPPVSSPEIWLAAGGRADFTFVMPAGGVRLDTTDGPSLLLLPPGSPATTVSAASHRIDPLHYGQPAGTPFDASSAFDRDFTLVLDQKFARFNGTPTFAYTVNGNAYPEIPTQLVNLGDLVRFTIVGRGYEVHPIHPHGHHVLVLSVNGVAPTGSPLWMDTFEVRPGDVVRVAMRADNPGVWMDHCHDLRHAAEGMVFHLAYAGVTSPHRMSRGE